MHVRLPGRRSARLSIADTGTHQSGYRCRIAVGVPFTDLAGRPLGTISKSQDAVFAPFFVDSDRLAVSLMTHGVRQLVLVGAADVMDLEALGAPPPSTNGFVATPTEAPRPNADQVGRRRLETFRRLLAPMRPGRLLDLGAGHGRFSLIAHELGWEVTAVDARTTRMPNTPGIRWIESDVRRFDVAGFDVIAILGLLYHLELPDQLALLRRCAATTTILDTHTSLHPDMTLDGYEGHVFREVAAAAEEHLADIPTASWGNLTSFWPTRGSLVRMLRDVGFGEVLVLDPPITRDRTFYLAV